ncbi:ubiquitin-like superfamily protein isoform X2 [Wolffia australiana]
MADKSDAEATNSSRVGEEDLDATVEINVKTLDSRVFPFRVKKNITVLILKEKIANVIGTPVEQQRLIFRGKVLKDDHLLSAYHADNGDTIHLVSRQPVQGETPLLTSSAGATGNAEAQGNNPAASNPWSGVVAAVGQNVVIRPINFGQETANIGPEVTRIIGSVLSSLGLGTQTPSAAGMGNSTSSQANSSSQSTQMGASNATSLENLLYNSGNVFPIAVHDQNPVTTPDSLATLLSYMSRMESMFASLGYESVAPGNEGSSRLNDIPMSTAGLQTPERLGDVMMQAFYMLIGQGAVSLFDVAKKLRRQQFATDPTLRAGIQLRASHVGAAMQHLGAMLLELSRDILTLQMGVSPASATINTGPALYISERGPNPIMVQPPMYGIPFGIGGYPGQVRTGEIIHDLNIRVHSGTPVRPTGDSMSGQGHPAPPAQGPEQTEEPEARTRSAEIPSAPAKHKASSSAQLPTASSSAPEGPATGSGSSTAVEGTKVAEKKAVPRGLGLGGLQQPKGRGKRTAPQSETMAIGQQVLQTLASQAEAGNGSSRPKNEQSREGGGFDFSRLFSQMIPVVSQALGAAGSADGDAPRLSPPEDQISQADIKAVLERLVNGDSRGSVFQAMVESAVRLMSEDGNQRSQDLAEALGEDDEILDGFFDMMKKVRREKDGSGSSG